MSFMDELKKLTRPYDDDGAFDSWCCDGAVAAKISAAVFVYHVYRDDCGEYRPSPSLRYSLSPSPSLRCSPSSRSAIPLPWAA